MNNFKDPTKAELVKAVHELSVLCGTLLSRSERDCIRLACTRLVAGWAVHNIEYENLEAWLDVKGVVKQASEEGYQEHLRLKEHA